MTRALIRLASGGGLPSNTSVNGGLVELARRHGLIGVLAGEIGHDLVKAIHVRQMTRESVMIDHLRRLLTELDAAGIRTAVVKGPMVAQKYPSPGLRSFSDIDLLVEDHRLESALEVIAADEAVAEIPERRPKASKRDVVIGDRSGVRFNTDLHWDLFSYSQFRGAAVGATRDAWERAVLAHSEVFGPHWVLPEAHNVAFLATHAVLDHRFRLILFRDLVETARHGLDWDDLSGVSHRWGLRSTTYLALWIARGATGAAVPEDFLEAVRPSSAALTYLERAIPRLDLARFDGHTAHPVNLASVLLNDSRADRVSLLMRAPIAFPGWKRRVTEPEEPRHTPRTLIVVSTDRRRGAEVFSERLRDGLGKRGWVVDAVSLRGTGSEPRADVEALTLEDEGSGGRFEWTLVRALRRKIRTYRPELIIANGGATLRYSLAARLGMGIDLAYIGIGEPQYWIRSKPSRWANRMMLRLTDLVLAVSETTRRQLVALEPSVADKSFTVFTGIGRSSIDMRGRDPSGPLRVVMVGSLTSEKDPSLALRAVAAVEAARLRFVGDGPLAASLGRESDDLGMADRVDFVGSVEDVSAHLEWAHVLILTSLTEGLPGAILEASAAGLPVVAVDVGGVREAVLDGETGFVTGREVWELVDRLRRLDEDRGLLRKMGEEGRRYVADNFLIDDVVARYHSVLKSRPK